MEASASISLAVKSDGTVWSWGFNSKGQLGNSSTTNSNLPAQVSGFTGALAVAGDSNHSLALTSDGSIWAWGDNTDGQFGNGATAASTVPVLGPSGFAPVPPLPPALGFIPVTPCRVADTRNPVGPFGGPTLSGGTPRSFSIPSSACNIPPTAAAYALNVTVVPTVPLGFLTVYPTGVPLPVTSTLNSWDGRVKANAAIVPAGTGGGVSVYATSQTDVILDISGYFVPSTPSALEFFTLTRCRIADTRTATGPLGGPFLAANQQRAFPILSSTCNVPSTAQAYSLNFTAVPHGGLGHLTTWPTGQSQPVASTLNSWGGQVTANAAIVPAGTAGEINVFASDDTDLVIDINGYFAPAPGGLSLYNLTPCRVLDTRNPSGAPPFSGTQTTSVFGSLCGADASAQAFVFDATVVPAVPLGHLTLWPEGQPQPNVSTLNSWDGVVTSNMAILPATNGLINEFATSSTHLILDISGYFAP